jgi:5-(hydroxymethyl)furfural/furfural oxidase
MAYLTEQVRQRPNLTVLADTTVQRLIIRNGRVCGVEAHTLRGPTTYSTREVVVACGAIHSPTLLLRSGIGPVQQLRSLGIDVIQNLPGVGRNLQNHPVVLLAMYLRRSGMLPANQRAWQQNLLRYSSKIADCTDHDMLLLTLGKVAWHPLGRRMAALGVIVNKAYSKGCVELVSADPTMAPRVYFNLLDDRRDFERLVSGFRMALEVLDDDDIVRVRNEVFLSDSDIAAHLDRRCAWNWVQAWIILTLLRIGPVRRAVLGGNIIDVRAMAQDEGAIRDYVRRHAQAVYHVCGTCRMGGTDDPEAVVDPNCRVFGVDGLCVVDASVFPSVPAGATHFPVLMTAEKIADQIKAQWRNQRSPELARHQRSGYAAAQ